MIQVKLEKDGEAYTVDINGSNEKEIISDFIALFKVLDENKYLHGLYTLAMCEYLQRKGVNMDEIFAKADKELKKDVIKDTNPKYSA